MSKKKKNKQIGLYVICIVSFLILHYLFNLKLFHPIERFIPFLKKLSFTAAVVSIILLIRTLLEKLIIIRTTTKGDQYNLLRVTKLISTILIVFVAISFMFQQPYSFLAGLGVASLVLGFALQAPITSFIAWLYVIFRRPFLVGDRIQIGVHRGDVVEINYLDTIIFECSGDYLGNDRKSGRLIHFPNSLILTDRVINYSGDQDPFIWNETVIQVAYTSDLDFVEQCLLDSAATDFNTKYPHRKNSSTHWKPAVYFRTNPYAWMEVVVQYPVEPFDTTGRRNRILRRALPLLNAQPEKVQFPEGTAR